MPFVVTQTDPEIVIKSGVTQEEKNRYCTMSFICGIQKNRADELISKDEIESQVQKTTMDTKVGSGGGMYWKIGIDIYTLLFIKQLINENLPYSPGISTQCSVVVCMGRVSKKEWIYIYVQLIHFAIQQKLTQHCKMTILQ